jgi:hypothetical protein
MAALVTTSGCTKRPGSGTLACCCGAAALAGAALFDSGGVV